MYCSNGTHGISSFIIADLHMNSNCRMSHGNKRMTTRRDNFTASMIGSDMKPIYIVQNNFLELVVQ